MVALHIFRDTGLAYTVPRESNDPTKALYNQSTAARNSFRWGVSLNPINGNPTNGTAQYGLPHVPTNKTILRLEVPNAETSHTANNNPNFAIEFFWLADHDPITLPDSLGICRPGTILGYSVDTELGTTAARVNLADDFYIVFAEDGKVATVLVDYDLYTNLAARLANVVSNDVYPDPTNTGSVWSPGTWSASGLCIYDTAKAKSLADNNTTNGVRYSYLNSQGCLVTLSPYTGLPLTEVTR
jgi:hypothetical protein